MEEELARFFPLDEFGQKLGIIFEICGQVERLDLFEVSAAVNHLDL